MKKVAWWLVIIGALNWGLVGVSYFVSDRSWDLVGLIFGNGVVANIIFIVVGISAIAVLMGHCGCKSCKMGGCNDCAKGTCGTHKKEGGSM